MKQEHSAGRQRRRGQWRVGHGHRLRRDQGGHP